MSTHPHIDLVGHWFEGQFLGHNSAKLFYQGWEVEDPVGLILLTHGIAEHSECYQRFAKQLNQFGWNVYGWDLRGHGRSQGKRGYVDQFDDMIEDHHRFFQFVHSKFRKDGHKLVVFGHSMGGLITLKSLAHHPKRSIDAVALSAPALGLVVKVSPVKLSVAKLASKWLPRMTMWNEVRYEDLTRIDEVWQSYPRDPLRHDKISPRLGLGMMDSFDPVIDKASEFRWPLLIQVAGADLIIDNDGSKAFFERVPGKNKTYQIYPDSYHEIYNDLDADTAFQDLKKFLNKI